MRRAALTLLLLLGGCRYTFWPPIPPEAKAEPTTLVRAKITLGDEEARLVLKVLALDRPGYLTLRWNKDQRPLFSRDLFVEHAPFEAELDLPLAGPGLYRLEVLEGDRLTYAALIEVGEVTPPAPPAPPGG